MPNEESNRMIALHHRHSATKTYEELELGHTGLFSRMKVGGSVVEREITTEAVE